MHVITRRRLREFAARHPEAERSLNAWFHAVSRVRLTTPADVKALFASASFLSGNWVVFNVGGNNYRIVVVMLYRAQCVLVQHVLTHREYDDMDLS